jgi:hypothetical protein
MMKDKLGREIKVGDTVVAIAMDYGCAGGFGGRPYLKTHVVSGAAEFALQLDDGQVITRTDEVVVIEMNRNIWGVDTSGKTGA